MKRNNIRIIATGLFLSVCGVALGSAALSTSAAAQTANGGGGGGSVGGGGNVGGVSGTDSASVYSVDQTYGGKKLNTQVPPTGQPKLMQVEKRDLHRCEGAIRKMWRDNGRRIMVCDIVR